MEFKHLLTIARALSPHLHNIRPVLMADGLETFTQGDLIFHRCDTVAARVADDIQAEPHRFGAFHSQVVKEVTGWPSALIQALLDHACYQELVEALVESDKLDAMIAQYQGDYAEHFAPHKPTQYYVKLCRSEYFFYYL